MIVFSTGIEKLSKLSEMQLNIEKEKAKIVGFETYASQSGSLLNDAEATKKTMELAAQNKAGTAGTIVTDASSTSNVKNVTIVQKTGTNDGRGFK